MLLTFLFILFFQVVGASYADELSMLGDQQVIESKAEVVIDKMPIIQPQAETLPAQPQSLSDMDDYIHQEENRIKAIKLLSLDLEKANIELKQREVQVKLAELNKSGVFTAPVASFSAQEPIVKRLISLMATGDFKEAVIEVNGAGVIVHEGDSIADGKVKHINDKGLLIVYEDGQEEQLRLN